MFKRNSSIKQIVKAVTVFLSQHIRLEKLILFGSYVYGKPRKDSDFDIAVISEDFEKMNVLDKIALFSNTAKSIDCRIELLGFSKKEYSKTEATSFLAFIKKKGKVVFSKK